MVVPVSGPVSVVAFGANGKFVPIEADSLADAIFQAVFALGIVDYLWESGGGRALYVRHGMDD